MRTHPENQIRLVQEWNDKWYLFFNLIAEEIFSGENIRWSLQPRNMAEELHYLSLRFWFIDNETEFLSIWRSFISYGGLDLKYFLEPNPGLAQGEIEAIKNIDNPFRGYYEPSD